MEREILNRTKFWFDEIVYNKLTKEKGIVGSLHYEESNFYTYGVIYANGMAITKEVELLTEEEFQELNLLGDD